MPQPLEGKTALVTGASKGIGKGIAIELARRGCNVAINYNRDSDGAELTVKQIESLGRRAIAVGGHVGRSRDVDHMFTDTLDELGRLDILVNNAGVQTWKPLLDLEEDDPEQLTKRMQKQWIVKKAGQPLSHQNCASIFKNPRGMSAGMLIDQAGLKGTRVGGAEVSQRHANFIVAAEGATSQDVLRLIDMIRSRVAERLGVELETELEIW